MKGEEVSLLGLVVSENAYSEDSAICSLATKDGLIPLLASRVHKPKSGLKPLLLVGNLVEVLALKREKGPYLARQAEIRGDSSLLLSTLEGNAFLLFVKETAQRLYRYGDRYPYEEVLSLLNALEEGKDLLSLSLLFLGLLYQSLGLEVETKSCVLCQKKTDIVSYSIREGGFLCRDCQERLGYPRKEEMELYVLKYAFLPIDGKSLSKVVPAKAGRNVLVSLAYGLSSYFDLESFHSLPFLLEQCRKE